MTRCCVKSCPSRPGCPGVSFFRFPAIGDIAAARRRTAWLKAIGDVKMDPENVLICSRHFVYGRPGKLEESQAGTNDMSGICRLCLGKEEKPTKLFQDGTGVLLQKIYDLTTLKITPKTAYPAAICATCHTKLDEYSKFREKCIENDGILRMIVGDVDDEEDNVGSSDQSTVSQSEFTAPEAVSSTTVVAVSTAPIPKIAVIPTKDLVATDVSSTGQNIVNKTSQDGRPKCVICARSFRTIYTLRRHMIIHMNENMSTCGHCFRRFNDPTSLKNHLRIHTEHNLLSCAICFNTFISPSSLKYHLRVHHKLEVFECRLCGEIVDTYEELATHVKAKHDHVQQKAPTNNNTDDSTRAPTSTTPGSPGEKVLKDGPVQIKQKPMKDGTLQSDPDGRNQVQRQPTVQKKVIMYRCDRCMKIFPQMDAARVHVQTAHNEK